MLPKLLREHEFASLVLFLCYCFCCKVVKHSQNNFEGHYCGYNPSSALNSAPHRVCMGIVRTALFLFYAPGFIFVLWHILTPLESLLHLNNAEFMVWSSHIHTCRDICRYVFNGIPFWVDSFTYTYIHIWIYIDTYIYSSFSQLSANSETPQLAESSIYAIVFFQAFFDIQIYLYACVCVFINQQIFIYEYHSVEA